MIRGFAQTYCLHRCSVFFFRTGTLARCCNAGSTWYQALESHTISPAFGSTAVPVVPVGATLVYGVYSEYSTPRNSRLLQYSHVVLVPDKWRRKCLTTGAAYSEYCSWVTVSTSTSTRREPSTQHTLKSWSTWYNIS
jgi:hypothetical protein